MRTVTSDEVDEIVSEFSAIVSRTVSSRDGLTRLAKLYVLFEKTDDTFRSQWREAVQQSLSGQHIPRKLAPETILNSKPENAKSTDLEKAQASSKHLIGALAIERTGNHIPEDVQKYVMLLLTEWRKA